MEEDLALSDVIFFEDLKEGREDLVLVHLVLILLEDLCLLGKQQEHHCVDMLFGDEMLWNFYSGK